MEVKCLALGQQTGQRLLRSMTSPVFVTIKSLNFHNQSASLCQREKPVNTHAHTHTHIFSVKWRHEMTQH